MKRYYTLIIYTFVILTGTLVAYTPGKGLGLGLMLGEPTGLAFKYHLNKTNSIDGGLGLSLVSDGFHLHTSYSWHKWNLFKAANIPVYFGPGVVFESRKDASRFDTRGLAFGLRAQGGIEAYLKKSPVSFFGEIALHWFLIPNMQLDLAGSIGARYWLDLK